ncbi:MAG: cytochrome c, partial [Proteobacteria bacterium]|nr:cytochrome c [Pseudomonadota bacterium]
FLILGVVVSCADATKTEAIKRLSGDANKTDGEKGPVHPGVMPGTETGDYLYGQNCASCHGQLSVSTRRGRTAEEITKAIATEPQMTFFQNRLSADQIAKIADSLKNVERPAQPPSVLDKSYGVTLYTNICSTCHGALAQSSKINRTAVDILRARTSNPIMKNIAKVQALSNAEIASIALALESTGPSEPIPASLELKVQNRRQMQAKLKRLFTGGLSAAATTEVTNIINTEVGLFPEVFGQQCVRTDKDCISVRYNSTRVDARNIPMASVLRAGRLYRSCLALAANQNAQTAFVKIFNGTGAVTASPTKAQIAAGLSKVALGYAASNAASTAVDSLVAKAKAVPYSTTVQWQMVTVSICSSLITEGL